MSNINSGNTNGASTATQSDHKGSVDARRSTETKAATKTTEFFIYIAMVIATIITAVVVGDGDNEDGIDMFDARQGMEFITYLTIAYMIARGLAKSGSRERYDA
ncbi:hypothetical protein [Arthrobacter sp. CAL618]|uniref:hypothetical protein n=1 Tax=Arthrobacter sp. CAL618 TaxID=1055770 RepID=UPI0004184BD2|nr:hypothetical protein [Arthrobacter sp. CAL618]